MQCARPRALSWSSPANQDTLRLSHGIVEVLPSDGAVADLIEGSIAGMIRFFVEIEELVGENKT